MTAQTPKPDPDFLPTFLETLTASANEMFEARVYVDSDSVPTAAAGVGSVLAAAFVLSAELAAHTDADTGTLADILAQHSIHVHDTLGTEAWPDVLASACLYLTRIHLEAALAVTDGTGTPLRGAFQAHFDALRGEQPDPDATA